MKSIFLFFLLAIILVVPANSLFGQNKGKTYKAWIKTTQPTTKYKGFFVANRNDEVELRDVMKPRKMPTLVIPKSTITSFKTRRKGAIGRGALIGAGTGLLTGLVLGLATGTNDVEANFFDTTSGGALVGGTFFSVLGAGVGAGIGAIKVKVRLK